MLVNDKAYQTVWMDGNSVMMVNQNLLPFEFSIHECKTHWDTCMAITDMTIRGAGAIGAAAGFAMAQAFMAAAESNNESLINEAKNDIEATRPTARNLFYAVSRVFEAGRISAVNARTEAQRIALRDMEDTLRIGKFGNELIRNNFNILTHCNAGWLAFVDHGTALSPIYEAFREGKNVFVYVGETRPRGQGARLTAWELHNEGVEHVIVSDNAVASLMAQKKIDMVIVGADRIARNGDVANKIGTLDRAILAQYYGIPFYVAAPTSTFDDGCASGKDIPLEERSMEEVLYQDGTDSNGNRIRVLVCSPGSRALNPSFDVSPAKLITGIITEKGIIPANEKDINTLLHGH